MFRLDLWSIYVTAPWITFSHHEQGSLQLLTDGALETQGTWGTDGLNFPE